MLASVSAAAMEAAMAERTPAALVEELFAIAACAAVNASEPPFTAAAEAAGPLAMTSCADFGASVTSTTRFLMPADICAGVFVSRYFAMAMLRLCEVRVLQTLCPLASRSAAAMRGQG